jgi:DNA modification methylase
MNKIKLMQGDNIESLKKLPDNSIDSIVSDPPYGLSFMGKKWDYDVPSVDFWKEVYRALKPGGHVLSFGGTRTYHRMTVNIEDAGFEIRDQIMWLYGSGFPKSLNIGKAVDKIQGNEREVDEAKTELYKRDSDYVFSGDDETRKDYKITKGTSEWEGWGTALKPANEPICVARKPISEKTIALNVLKWGTGGINIDGCRVGIEGKDEEGRFPANIILDEEAGQVMDEQSGFSKTTAGASRFFYQAKVGKKERNMGLDGFEDKESISQQVVNAGGTGAIGNTNPSCQECKGSRFDRGKGVCKCDEPVWNIPKNNTTKNNHPTVKPVSLMAYLVRLVTPPNGIVLDPFMGSGSTGIAARLEDFRFCGMEMDEDYFRIAESRINNFESYREFIKK